MPPAAAAQGSRPAWIIYFFEFTLKEGGAVLVVRGQKALERRNSLIDPYNWHRELSQLSPINILNTHAVMLFVRHVTHTTAFLMLSSTLVKCHILREEIRIRKKQSRRSQNCFITILIYQRNLNNNFGWTNTLKTQ